jgi:uncharacterized membrane protein YjjB (DUF3815 family)
MGTAFWAAVGTTIATLIVLVPGVVYAYYVLASWVEDPRSYARIVAAVESAQKRPPSHGSV